MQVTYTLTAAEEGKKVLVEVSFTDNAGNSEGPLGSAVTLPIIPASVVLVSNTAQGKRLTDFEYNATVLDVNSMGQAFIAGNNPTGYTFTSVTIISEDPQGDDLALELCEVGTDGNTPENCTVLTPPASFTIGPLFFYAPTGSTLTLSNGSTYMVVLKSPGGQRVDVDGTLSDGEDASSLHNWSIHDKPHFKAPERLAAKHQQQSVSHRHQRHRQSNRPRRPHRPLGNGQREHQDQPLLDGTGQHRRLRHHRLQDRIILRCRLQLDRPRRRHQTTPTPLTSTPASPAVTPATTGSPPSTRSAPAPPPTPPTQPPPR